MAQLAMFSKGSGLAGKQVSLRSGTSRRGVNRAAAPKTEAKKVRVAINGFGRIGRNFLRCYENRSSSELEVRRELQGCGALHEPEIELKALTGTRAGCGD